MNSRKAMIVGLVAGLVIGWVAFDGGPIFTPDKPDRPVLRWVARMAKSMLWVMVFAEPAPRDESAGYAKAVHFAPDGTVAVDHARGL
jgi:hypothetical protein